MKQILHIFGKDVRHHLLEILVYVTLLLAFTGDQPRQWAGRTVSPRLLEILVNSLPVLLVISWAFAVIRVVQSEKLVGDRLFWITRPYEWPKLLAAKLLWFMVFLHLPLLLVQLFLLHFARFPALKSIPLLLLSQLMLAGVLTLPAFAIGSVSSGIGQAMIFVLGCVLALGGLFALSNLFPNFDLASDAFSDLQAFIVLGSCIGVVLLQYSRRKSLVSRLWLLGIPISIAVMIAVIPYKRIVTGYFPLAEPGREAIARFSLDPDLIFTGGAASGYRYRGKDVQLQFPILIAGMPEDSFIEVRAIRLQLESPTGTVWDSEWNSNYTKLLPGRTRVWPEFNIPQSVYEKNTSMPVRAKIWLGMNVYRLTRATTVTFGQSEFLLPNGERCARRAESGELTCLAPVSLPSLRLITADLPTRRCQPPFSNPDEAFSASSAFQAVTGNDSGTEPMLSPIQEFNITLTRPHALENDETRTPLCQGLPFAISTPEFRFSYGAEVEMKQTVLSDYLSDFSRKIERRKSVPKGLHAERIAAPAIRRRSHAVGGSE